MNLFIGIGKINDIEQTPKVLKFNLSINQQYPCKIPCIIFNPIEEAYDEIQTLKELDQVVWIKGILNSKEFVYHGIPTLRIQVSTYLSCIKTI